MRIGPVQTIKDQKGIPMRKPPSKRSIGDTTDRSPPTSGRGPGGNLTTVRRKIPCKIAARGALAVIVAATAAQYTAAAEATTVGCDGDINPPVVHISGWSEANEVTVYYKLIDKFIIKDHNTPSHPRGVAVCRINIQRRMPARLDSGLPGRWQRPVEPLRTDGAWAGLWTMTVYGGSGVDFLHGGDRDDRLRGDSGNDWLYARRGKNDLEGGSGTDNLYGQGRSFDVLDGGPGGDRDGGDMLSGGDREWDEASYYGHSLEAPHLTQSRLNSTMPPTTAHRRPTTAPRSRRTTSSPTSGD
jgi:hypothetical protein